MSVSWECARSSCSCAFSKAVSAFAIVIDRKTALDYVAEYSPLASTLITWLQDSSTTARLLSFLGGVEFVVESLQADTEFLGCRRFVAIVPLQAHFRWRPSPSSRSVIGPAVANLFAKLAFAEVPWQVIGIDRKRVAKDAPRARSHWPAHGRCPATDGTAVLSSLRR